MSEGESERVKALDGTRIHVAAAGPGGGEPVVLLHGFPDCSWGWRKQIMTLAEAGFRTMAPDLRGYGRSDCPRGVAAYTIDRLVEDVLAVGGEAPFHLVGHDWGGIVGWAAAALQPARIKALTILNAPHPDAVAGVLRRHPSQIARSAYVGFFQLTGFAETVLRASDYRLLEMMLRHTAHADTFTAEDRARYRQEWARPGCLTGMLNYYRALVRLRRGPLGRIAVPTQILWGMRDPALGFALAEASLTLCEDGRLIRFADASHWPQRDEADAVNAAIISFHQSAANRMAKRALLNPRRTGHVSLLKDGSA